MGGRERSGVTRVLLDTHVWVWALTGNEHLSVPARSAIEAASVVYVSPISFFEIGQKVRLGKWPEMATFASDLPVILRDQGGVVASLTPEICLHASLRDWDHRDPFDRVLASTAELMALPLVSKDPAFAELDALHRIW